MLTRRALLVSTTAVTVFTALHHVDAAPPANLVVMGKRMSDMTSLDPHEGFEVSGSEVNVSVYQRLTGPAEGSDDLAGQLAERWDMAADGKTYTFHLKRDARFASGNPVTAGDVLFSMTRLVTMNKSPAFMLTQLGLNKDTIATHVKVVDAHTLTIALPEQFAPTFLLFCLSHTAGSVVEKALVLANQKDGDFGNAWLKTNSAGSGPLVLKAWRASESVTLDVNPHYNGQKPAWRRLVLQQIEEPASQLLALQQGDIDIARDLGPDQLRSLNNDPKFTLLTSRRAAQVYLALNQKHPILSKPQVRQALKWAIDYDAIEKNITPGYYEVHQSFIPKDFPCAIADRPFRKDSARAKALLAEAGYPDGFEIRLDHYSSGLYPDIVQVIQANLAEIGIRAELQSGEARAVITKTRERRHEVALLAWGADYMDPHGNTQAFCINEDNSDTAALKSVAWRSAWQDAEVTALGRAAVRELDAAKRVQMYITLQRMHHERSPFVMMMQQLSIMATQKTIGGFTVGAMSDRTQYATIRKA